MDAEKLADELEAMALQELDCIEPNCTCKDCGEFQRLGALFNSAASALRAASAGEAVHVEFNAAGKDAMYTEMWVRIPGAVCATAADAFEWIDTYGLKQVTYRVVTDAARKAAGR